MVENFLLNQDYSVFVGRKFNYYAQKWNRIAHKRNSSDLKHLKRPHLIKDTSINLSAFFWSALLLLPAWIAYRKMYKQSMLFITVVNSACLILSSAFFYIFDSIEISFFVYWALNILQSFYMNKMYLVHVDNKVSEIKKISSNEVHRTAILVKEGGNSVLGSMVFIYCVSPFLYAASFAFSAFLATCLYTNGVIADFLGSFGDRKEVLMENPINMSLAILQTSEGTIRAPDLIRKINKSGAAVKIRQLGDETIFSVDTTHDGKPNYVVVIHNPKTEKAFIRQIRYEGDLCHRKELSRCVDKILGEIKNKHKPLENKKRSK